MAQETENVMRAISIEKVVLNMGVGKSGDAIETAKKALDQISGKKSCNRSAKKAHRDWGVRKGEPIGASVTVRGDTVNGRSLDKMGNISFGILEHIDIPGIKYDPKIGILGLDVSVRLARSGFNIRIRSKHKASVGVTHKITPAEAKAYLTKEFGVVVS